MLKLKIEKKNQLFKKILNRISRQAQNFAICEGCILPVVPISAPEQRPSDLFGLERLVGDRTSLRYFDFHFSCEGIYFQCI
jgi:hypothetical protein